MGISLLVLSQGHLPCSVYSRKLYGITDSVIAGRDNLQSAVGAANAVEPAEAVVVKITACCINTATWSDYHHPKGCLRAEFQEHRRQIAGL